MKILYKMLFIFKSCNFEEGIVNRLILILIKNKEVTNIKKSTGIQSNFRALPYFHQ
jgi:hypothetical protein